MLITWAPHLQQPTIRAVQFSTSGYPAAPHATSLSTWEDCKLHENKDHVFYFIYIQKIQSRLFTVLHCSMPLQHVNSALRLLLSPTPTLITTPSNPAPSLPPNPFFFLQNSALASPPPGSSWSGLGEIPGATGV